MEVSVYELASLVVCFLLSGFFSGSEAVLMSIDIDRAKQIVKDGGTRARALQFMVEKPSELLATILVGNNIVNIVAASLSTVIATRLFQDDGVGISVGVTTIIILIFGEVIPKSFSRSHAEPLSAFVIRALQFFYYLMYPVVKTMVWIVEIVLGENAQLNGRMITKNDIEYMVQKAEKERTMDSKHLDLLNSILEFPTIKVKDIMIPRSRVKYLKCELTFEQVIAITKEDTHSRYPVCEDNLEGIKGFLHVKDLLYLTDEDKENFSVELLVKAPFFVYEHMKIQAVFDHMNRKKIHLALVKDENGLTVGIITLEDIVEEVLGEIEDEHDIEEEAIGEPDQTLDDKEGILVEGSMSIRDLYNEFDIKIPLNNNYSTIAGFILDMLGNSFPEEGQIIVWEGFSFELQSVVEFAVRDVRIKTIDGEKHLFSKKEAIKGDDTEIKPIMIDKTIVNVPK